MPYKFLEDIAVADVAFEAFGKTLAELLKQAGLATENVMIERLETIKPKVRKRIRLKADNPEKLLHDFLQELIFLKDAKQLLFSSFRLKTKEGRGVSLEGELIGEKLDPKRHTQLVDVKAVSWHMFKVERTRSGWRAMAILDV